MDPTQRKRAKKLNVTGHAHFLTFSCYQRLPLLTNDAWRRILADALRKTCDDYAVALWAYVFMPEHVHLLLKPRRASYDLAACEQSLKTGSAMKILAAMKDVEAPLLQRLRVEERPGRWMYRFWQEGGGYDTNLWNMRLIVQKASYCHSNPVKRRLVRDPAKWHWSSYRWLELGARDNEPIRVDDWDERLLDE